MSISSSSCPATSGVAASTGMPPSPTASYTSTAVPPSTLNLLPSSPPPDILSRADVAHSITAYETLLSAAKVYRKALAAVSAAASSFGAALETCARCKGTGANGHGILNASGLQYLIGSNMHILSEALHRGFEAPLLHELDMYKEKTTENEEGYKREEAKRGTEWRKRESELFKLAHQRRRSYSSYHSALTNLTHSVDGLNQLKYQHYRVAHSLTTDASNRILDYVSLVIRAEVEIFEKVAQKGWDGAGGGLDDLIARAQDPFAPETGGEDSANGSGALFSILPAHSILPSPHSPVMQGVGTISAVGVSSAVGIDSGDAGVDSTNLRWGQKTGKYRTPLTDALSPPRALYSDEDDERSIFSGGGFSTSTLDTVALVGGPIGTDNGEGGNGDHNDDASSLRIPPPKLGEPIKVHPPLSPSVSSAGWGGPHGDDEVAPFELNSPVGLKYHNGVISGGGEGDANEAATIRPGSSSTNE